MTQSSLRGRLGRTLVLYLVLAMLPTPFVVSWLLTRPLRAAPPVDERPLTAHRPSLTDLAPPQPVLAADPAESPRARLTGLGLEPEGRLSDIGSVVESSPGSVPRSRKAQVDALAAQLGDRRHAERVMANIERPIPRTRTLFAPRRKPEVPDPFVRLPTHADYRRGPR
jgi:hypothetical protein